MKRVISLLVVLAMLGVSGVRAQQTVAVKASSNTQLRLTLSSSDLKVSTVAFAGDTFSRIEMASFGNSYQVGAPDVPVLSKMIEVPVGAQVQVKVLSETHTTYDAAQLGMTHRLIPVQPARHKSDTTAPRLVIDNAVYAKNAMFALPMVKVTPAGIARDRNLANLQFSPVQYNPVTNQVVKYDNVEVQIDFVGADIAATQQLKLAYGNGAFGAGINTINTLPAAKDMNLATPIRYTIIAHSMFRNNLDTFVAWKKRQGYLVDIHFTDEPEIGTTNTSIAAYLKSQYTNATAAMPAPTYVLLVGDHQQIPAFAGRNTMQSDWSSGRISDLYYFTWTTGDNIPDCYYGRFSAQNVNQLTPQVEKTLYYEQYQFNNPAYLDKAMIVAGTDQGTSGDNAYTCGDPTGDYIVTNYVNGDHGYSQVHYYKNLYSQAPTATNVTTYSNGGYSASSSSHSTAVAVKNEINEGRGWFNYSAHGNWDGFSIPAFGINQVGSLSATNKFGVIIGNCCLTNSFQQSECFGESLLRKQGAGAVAYIGASDYTYWYQDFYWAVGYRTSVSNPTYSASHKGCYDRMFHTHNESFDQWATTVGGLMYAGNMAVQEAGQSTMSHYYWEVYHIMGDPSLQPWMGQAQTLTNLNYAPSIPMTAQSYDVTTVPYAHVALTLDGELIASAFANASGAVSFPISNLVVGQYELAIMAQGYKPTFRDVTVIADGPYVRASNLMPSASLEAGTTVTFDVDLQNYGVQTANSIDVTLRADTSLVTLVRNHTQVVGMTPDYAYTANNAFSVLVKTGVTDMADCNFEVVSVWDNTDSAVYSVSFPVKAAAFENRTITAPESAGAAGATIAFVTANSGHAVARNVRTSMLCGNPHVTVANATQSYDSIDAGATISESYSISVASTFNGVHIVPFYHKVTDGIHTLIDTVELMISNGSAESFSSPFDGFESGNFDALAWENGEIGWTIVNSGAYNGTFAAKSDNVNEHNTAATLTIHHTSMINDSISFYYKVSSESGYDKFRFLVDGEEKCSASGNRSYTRYASAINAGTHEFTFIYEKDYSVSNGDDCAWIDNVTLPKTIARDTYVFDTICSGQSYSCQGHDFSTESLAAGQHHLEATLSDGSMLYVTLQVGVQLQVSNDVTIERGQSVVLVADGASAYQWSTGETGSTIVVSPSQTTTYTVTGTVGSCSDQATVTVTVTEPSVGIADAEGLEVRIYPNPASDVVNVAAADLKEVRLLNTVGQVVMVQSVNGNVAQLSVSGLVPGVYMVQAIRADGVAAVRKLVRK